MECPGHNAVSCLSPDHGRGAHAWHMVDTEILKLNRDEMEKAGAEGITLPPVPRPPSATRWPPLSDQRQLRRQPRLSSIMNLSCQHAEGRGWL